MQNEANYFSVRPARCNIGKIVDLLRLLRAN